MTRSTLPEMWWPLMAAPSIKLPWCAICGRADPLEQHHIVLRSAGRLYDEHGREVPKPTLTLCGFGNNLHDADGRPYCHGRAHHKLLHFRWMPKEAEKVLGKRNPCDYALGSYAVGGHLEYLETNEPCDYLTALRMPGWKRLP